MNALNLKVAVSLVNAALAAGRKINAAPLTVAVLDAGGHLLALQREDGASLIRPEVATGKAWGAIALGKGSRLLALAPWLPAGIARRWAGAYGSRSAELLQGVYGLHDLGEDFGGGLHAREVDFLREREWACDTDDILWRRSKLGLRLDAAQVARLQAWMEGRIPFPRKGL